MFVAILRINNKLMSRSGPHRYVLLVWEQHHSVSMEPPRSRARGDISKIVKSLDLKEPPAGNFFLAENK